MLYILIPGAEMGQNNDLASARFCRFRRLFSRTVIVFVRELRQILHESGFMNQKIGSFGQSLHASAWPCIPENRDHSPFFGVRSTSEA